MSAQRGQRSIDLLASITEPARTAWLSDSRQHVPFLAIRAGHPPSDDECRSCSRVSFAESMVRPAGSAELARRWMLVPRIEAFGLDLAHLACGEASRALDVFRSHRIGMRVARLADVVEIDFQEANRKNSMPSRVSASSTLSPILTRAPRILTVRRVPPSRDTIAS